MDEAIAILLGLAPSHIGASDNDHLQDSNFPTFADLPRAEFGSFPTALCRDTKSAHADKRSASTKR
jgi:hypothetical protein